MQQGSNTYAFFVWNFEFESLGFVWDLIFGACNFADLKYEGKYN
jgi:hypothetical protein